MSLISQIDSQKLPKHVAIIMDGNGRWAKERGLDRVYGHQQGVTGVHEVVSAAGELGIDYLTLYAFSTENWNRPKAEVDALMELLVKTIRKEIANLDHNNVRLGVIGDIESLPLTCQKEIADAIEQTKDNKGLNLILALSYSSKWELKTAIKAMAQKVKNDELALDDISDDVIKQHLATHAIPDPELMIRTGGEYRISNFLLYQLAYAELYFTDIQWPDFRKQHFYQAIIEFQNRERRFGKTSEQILQS
jgi:undecaprenyl diphosphate synthase